MSRKRITVCHLTHSDNVDSILAAGLDPAYSQGERPLIWLCAPHSVRRLELHVAVRHDWDLCDLVVFSVRVFPEECRATKWPGVITCANLIEPAFLSIVNRSWINKHGGWTPEALTERVKVASRGKR